MDSRGQRERKISEFSFFNEARSTRLFCSKFFDDPLKPGLCEGCGSTEEEHVEIPKNLLGPWQNAQAWRSDLHRVHLPRSCGPTPTHDIEFVDENEGIQKRAQLSILAVDSHPNLFVETLIDNWGLKVPDIIVSVTGTLNHVNLRHEEFSAFQSGLVKVVSTTKCWVITGGTNDGADELVSRALKEVQYLKWLGKNEMNFDLIGVTNWNCLAENRTMSSFWSGDSLMTPTEGHLRIPVPVAPPQKRTLIKTLSDPLRSRRSVKKATSTESIAPKDKTFKYFVKKTRSKATPARSVNVSSSNLTDNAIAASTYDRYETHLNPIFTHFVAIESAVREKHCELPARIQIENFCSKDKASFASNAEVEDLKLLNTPTVLLVFGGDAKTLEHMARSVENGIPVVLCQGSGGIVDYLILLLHKVPPSNDASKWPYYITLVRQLLSFLSKAKSADELFSFNQMHTATLEPLIFKCLQKRKLIKIYKLSNPVVNLHTCIFSALLDGKTAESYDPVKLSLRWNYCGEIVESILVQDADINARSGIQDLMMEAIEHEEKIQFARLFLQCGFTMEKFLTPRRLAQLYSRSYKKSRLLHDVLERCLGERDEISLNCVYDLCYSCTTSKPLHSLKNGTSFNDPYRELFFWALLNGRLKATEFFWMQASNQLILALIGSELCKVVAKSLTGDLFKMRTPYLEAHEEYIQKAYDILESAWSLNPQKAMLLLNTNLPQYGNTCVMDVAWFIEIKIVISHPCFQQVVQKMWTKGLSCYHGKIVTTLLNPFSVIFLKTSDQSSITNNQSSGQNMAVPWNEIRSQSDPSNELERRESNGVLDQIETVLHADRQSRANRRTSMEFEYTFGDPVDKEKIRDAWTIWKRKANLFYFSPACKFLIRLIFHLIFVILISKFYLFDFNYMSHVWLEYYIALYFLSTMLEIISNFWLKINMHLFSLKWRVWRRTEWNFLDVAVSVIGLIAFVAVPIQTYIVQDIKYDKEDTLPNMRKGFYALAVLLSWIRILRYYQYDKKLGTVWIMIRKMLSETLIFMSILFIFLGSFGVFFTSLFQLFEYEDAHSGSYTGVILRAFFIINGEYFLETMGETISEYPPEKQQEMVRLKSYYIMIVIIMLFVGNAMLLNTLIAIFGRIYATIMEKSDEEWKTERFTMVLEFQSRSFFPHPICIVASILAALKYLLGSKKTTVSEVAISRKKSVVVIEPSVEKSDLDKYEYVVVQTMLRNKANIVTKEYLIEESLRSKDKLLDRINFLGGNLEKFRKTKGGDKLNSPD